MKTVFSRFTSVISIILITLMLVSACAAETPRLPSIPTYSPGPAFTTNVNDPDPRRQIKCSLVFDVIDEQAVEELTERTYKVRNSILIVLAELTLEEVTANRDLDNILERIVAKVNEDLQTTGNIGLVVKAYFTEFAII